MSSFPDGDPLPLLQFGPGGRARPSSRAREKAPDTAEGREEVSSSPGYSLLAEGQKENDAVTPPAAVSSTSDMASSYPEVVPLLQALIQEKDRRLADKDAEIARLERRIQEAGERERLLLEGMGREQHLRALATIPTAPLLPLPAAETHLAPLEAGSELPISTEAEPAADVMPVAAEDGHGDEWDDTAYEAQREQRRLARQRQARQKQMTAALSVAAVASLTAVYAVAQQQPRYREAGRAAEAVAASPAAIAPAVLQPAPPLSRPAAAETIAEPVQEISATASGAAATPAPPEVTLTTSSASPGEDAARPADAAALPTSVLSPTPAPDASVVSPAAGTPGGTLKQAAPTQTRRRRSSRRSRYRQGTRRSASAATAPRPTAVSRSRRGTSSASTGGSQTSSSRRKRTRRSSNATNSTTERPATATGQQR